MRRSFLPRPVPEGAVAVLALWLGLLALFVLPASASAAGSVYVANFDNVSQYAIGAGGGLSPLTPATVATAGPASNIALTPDGGSAYVTVIVEGISQYDVNPLSGALSPKTPATVPPGTGGVVDPVGIAVTPDGRSAYVGNQIGIPGPSVSQFDIHPLSGALTPKAPATVATGLLPVSVVVTPDGRSAYVTNQNSNAVSQYDIDPVTGALSPKSPASVPTGTTPQDIAVTPDSTSAYVTNLDDATISQYDIDPASGALSPMTPADVATGMNPVGIAVTPDGESAYVLSDSSVVQYNIDPQTHALSPKNPATIAAGGSANRVAVAPDGRNAYVTNLNDDTVSQYDIDPQSGALSPKTPATVPTGRTPFGLAVGPLPRVPTSKEQCKNRGWRKFPQFKNEGQCITFVNHAP